MPQLKYWDVTQAAYIPLQIGNPPAYPNLPPALAAGAAFSTYTDAAGDLWVAKGGVYSGAWKRPRDVLHCRIYSNATFTLAATTETALQYQTVDVDWYGMWNAGATRLIAPVPGRYLVNFAINIALNANVRLFPNLYINGTWHSRGTDTTYNNMTGYNIVMTDILALNATDYAYATVYNGSSAGTAGGTIQQNYIECSYLGTG
jgi:hypothetical protein